MLLTRLTHQRQLDIAVLARSARVAESELSATLRGAVPSPALLRRLAPALGLHTADLFAIAGLIMPLDLVPTDPAARPWVPNLMWFARELTPEARDRVHQYASALPQLARRPADRLAAVQDRHSSGPGALLMRMTRNRNLDWTRTAKVFLLLTGRYWSPATYGSVAFGLAALPPDLILDFATVLGIAADDLAALTGVSLTGPASAPDPATAGLAELIWDVRRLTDDQVRAVILRARAELDVSVPRP